MKVTQALVLVSALFGFGLATDLTRIPNQYGAEVVEAVVNIIRESCLFADDKRFLRRLAYVESHDGTDPHTYRSGYDGGIWQVDQNAFRLTQNAGSLSNEYIIIQRVTGINWNAVTWHDLRMPLYSGIAAALYTKLKLGTTHSEMSWKTETQGSFWESNFHVGNKAYNFSQLATVLDLGCRPNQQVDMVMVLDTSSSLSTDDFARAKDFMTKVVQGFPIGPLQTQVGVISYSDNAHVEFYLNSHRNQPSVINAISTITYKPGSTNTGTAIDEAVSGVFNQFLGGRPNVVKVMVVITDGDSDDTIDTKNAANLAHSKGIITFSLGVGSAIHESELRLIASNPACTHVYKADNYAEIKFLVEEIQKATCIAPVLLQINQTYSCQLKDCPPFVGPTGTHGVTLVTSITCGGMKVYSSFNNPYPSPAQYQYVQNTLAQMTGNVSETFYNITGQNLYINFKDTQGLYRNDSAHCTASVQLCDGDCTDHPITMICYQNGAVVPCPPTNCSENWNFVNPCTQANILANKLRFPHPYDSDKFLMCDLSGKVYIAICPPGEVFNADCSQCLGAGTPVIAQCTHALPTSVANNCTRANILAGLLFFSYPPDSTKYIHCDIWGHPWLRSCQDGMHWEQDIVTCVRNNATNPCAHHVPGTPYLYPHPCNPHMYIHCDTNHQSFEQSCQLDYVYLKDSQTCVPPGSYPGTSNLVNTCSGNTGTTSASNGNPVYPTVAPVGSNIQFYTYVGGVHNPPCTAANVQSNNLYFPVTNNKHHYIQCDTFGHQYLRDCTGSGRDYYDPYSHTCVDGPVAVDNIVG